MSAAARTPWYDQIAQLPPLVKLAGWALAVCLLAAVVQLLAWAAGIDFSVLSKQGGSAVLIGGGLALLLMLIAAEQRPMADYGIVADRHWRRRAVRGLAIGAAAYAGYLALGAVLGVVTLRPEAVSLSRGLKALLAGLPATPIAATQQIIFSGYLLSTFRQRHSRGTSVLVPAVLFGLVTAATAPGGLGAAGPQRLLVSMTLLAALLGLLRLRSGSVVFPAGVLAGALLVRKVLGKSRVLEFDTQSPSAWWFAPEGDPRQGIAFGAMLVAGAAWAVWQLARHGEQRVEPDAEVDASFKRVMPFSNLLGMAPIDWWAPLLVRARLRVGFAYVPRLVVTLLSSTVFTLLALPERLLGPLVVRCVSKLRGDAPDPVFLVGMNRSGTTHVHNLLALDPRFRSPRNYEVFNPHGFVTGWLTTAVLTPFMTWRRPMDSVQMTITSAQEEEFALATMGNPSPYWSFCFPRDIAHHDRYFAEEGYTRGQRARWERHYRLFLRKLTLFRRRTPLLKNPANTGRVAWLHRHFPDARFVHVVRHPHAVYRSNLRFASQGLVVFQLQDPADDENYATRCLNNYRAMVDAFDTAATALPDHQMATVRFEDVEADPMGAIERLYDQLGMPLTDKARGRMEAYLASMRGYRKNAYRPLPDDQREQVDAAMGDCVRRWGYTDAARDAA